VYHYIHIGSGDVGKNVRFDIVKYRGQMNLVPTHLEAAVKKVPPYQYMNSTVGDLAINVCDTEVGDMFMGLLGAVECAVYDITAHIFEGDCHELPHTNEQITDASYAQDIHPALYKYKTCQPGGWEDLKLHLTPEERRNNLVFEVEDLNAANNPDSLEVKLFLGNLPSDRSTQYTASTPSNRIYSVALNYIELKFSTTNDFFLSVRCKDESVRFRAIAHVIHAALAIHVHHHGEVCPNQWSYHYIDNTGGASSDGGHRRAGSSGTTETVTGKHLRVKLQVFSGNIYLMAMRYHYPPGFNSQNAWTEIVSSANFTNSLHMELCNPGADYLYVGIYGGDSCAVYSIMADWFEGDCYTHDLIKGKVLDSGTGSGTSGDSGH